MHAMINPSIVFDLFCVFIEMGLECVGGLERVQIFSWRASKLSFRAFSSRRSSLTQTFVASCVDFEVAHLSILMVRRLQFSDLWEWKAVYNS